MRVLLVEDDENKRDEILELLNKELDVEIIHQKSFQTGKKALKEDLFDLVLLDMDIPTFDISVEESGGRKQAFGGRMLLYEMVRRRIHTKVIVVTQFDYFESPTDGLNIEELNLELRNNFPAIYYGYIQMRGDSIDWKENLINKIKEK